jgi:nucleoside phosphorylase/uncharacterized protein YqgV (UPF0045/DUF77 family)
MILLHFAHRGEAQQFLQHFHFNADSSGLEGLYQKDEMLLLISGEGIHNAQSKVAYVLGKYPVTKVYNLGIAGSLRKNISLDQIISIKTSYAYTDNKPVFNSFTSCSQSPYDCITTDARVLDNQMAKELSPFAELVDRELWGVAMACSWSKIALESFKYISDYAGDDTQCLDIKNHAQEYSQKLLEAFIDADQEENIIEKLYHPKDFYMTFSQKHQVSNLLHALEIKLEKTPSEILELAKAEHILAQDIRPKEKTIQLVHKLEQMLNPMNTVVEQKLKNVFAPIYDIGAQVQLDRQLEKKEFLLKMKINSETNTKKLSQAMNDFNFQIFENIMNGDLNDQ